jgi:hypothetical protein
MKWGLAAWWVTARYSTLMLALVCCLGATSAPELEELSGKWEGTFINSANQKGKDGVTIKINPDRSITGTWNGKKIENGEVVTDTVFQWESTTQGKKYLARCYVKEDGKVLVVEYTVTHRDAQGKVKGYIGTSTLTKK